MSHLSFTLKAPKISHSRTFKECHTLGDHLRKTRTDRNESQSYVAQKLGLTRTDSLTNWELNHFQPQARYNPLIIDYLGYTPLNNLVGTSLSKRIGQFLYVNGLTIKEGAENIDIDPSSLSKLIHEQKVITRTRKMVEEFFE